MKKQSASATNQETVIQFMLQTKNLKEIEKIIEKLPILFDSHEFIECFLEKFEEQYVIFLSNYSKNRFRTVNNQISKFLRQAEQQKLFAKFDIEYIGKTQSQNVRGKFSDNALWRKNQKQK
jgi:c-di-AMP phosphodiesterase-like protein